MLKRWIRGLLRKQREGVPVVVLMEDAFQAGRRAGNERAAEMVERFIAAFPDPTHGRIAPNALKPLAARIRSGE